MALLDIEKGIARKDIGSRFRLVNIANQRARELNSHPEGTTPIKSDIYSKLTTNALNEITSGLISFELKEIEEESK